jgi:hypothetical protein
MEALFLSSQRLITEHWPSVARLLEPVLEHVNGEFTLDDLQEMCRDGAALAGLAFDDAGEPSMAMVTEFRFFPRKVVLNVMALAGHDLQALASTFWPTFSQWALESGATEFQACARPAMTRMLGKLGFTHTYNVVRMPTGAPT